MEFALINCYLFSTFFNLWFISHEENITIKEVANLVANEIGFNGKKYTTKPGKAFLIDDPKFPLRSQKIRDERHGPTSWVSIVIKEGNFRQVRKMTAAVGFPTLRLIRVRIGEIKLGNLEISGVKEVDYFMW